MTVGERSDSSKPTSCQTQAMPYLYYCTLLQLLHLMNFMAMHRCFLLTFCHFMKKRLGRNAWLGYFGIFQPSATSPHSASPHFILHLPMYYVLEVKHIAQWVPLPSQIHARPFLSNSDLRALFYLELEIN